MLAGMLCSPFGKIKQVVDLILLLASPGMECADVKPKSADVASCRRTLCAFGIFLVSFPDVK